MLLHKDKLWGFGQGFDSCYLDDIVRVETWFVRWQRVGYFQHRSVDGKKMSSVDPRWLILGRRGSNTNPSICFLIFFGDHCEIIAIWSQGSPKIHPNQDYTNAGWWFGTSFIFAYIGNNHPNWLSYIPIHFHTLGTSLFFRYVETTNQNVINHKPLYEPPFISLNPCHGARLGGCLAKSGPRGVP